jgi:hypothetical protein
MTTDSYEPATGCARLSVRADGAGADLGSQFDRVCPAGRQPRSCSATQRSHGYELTAHSRTTSIGQHQQSEVRFTDAIGPRRSPIAGPVREYAEPRPCLCRRDFGVPAISLLVGLLNLAADHCPDLRLPLKASVAEDQAGVRPGPGRSEVGLRQGLPMRSVHLPRPKGTTAHLRDSSTTHARGSR